MVLGRDLAEILLEAVRLQLGQVSRPGLHVPDDPIEAVSLHRPILLVPVPSRRSSARARGGNHVARLAYLTARLAGPTVQVATPLRFRRQVSDSVGLSKSERVANMNQSMVAASYTPGRWGSEVEIIVLDDLITTGATLIEASRALRAAGWPLRGAAVVAAAPARPGSGVPEHQLTQS